MYKRCVTEQSARRQRALEQGLLEIMTTQRYEDISITDLCSSLGIPRKTFYRYFSSKDGALYALIDHTLMEFSLASFADGFLAAYGALEHFFAFWLHQRHLLDALERNGLSGLLVHRAIILASDDELFPPSLLPKHTPSTRQHVLLFVVSGIMSMVTKWHREDFYDTPQKMAKLTADLLSQPLLSPALNTTIERNIHPIS